jgi:hypothetical protein
MPLVWIFQCYLIGEAEASASHTKIANAQPGALLYDPNAGAATGFRADAGILVEQHKIVCCQRVGQHQVGAQTRGKGIDQASEQRLRQRKMTANYCKNCIDTGTNSVPNNRNLPHAGVRLGRDTPQEIGNTDVQGNHEAIRRACRKYAYILQNIVHMRLRNAARPRQPPLGQLACVDALSRDVDQSTLQRLKIHRAPIQLYFSRK